ncbi:SRPBCC family protein [Fervidibacter sacchari]|uniref:Ribosome-associated toxin RatA of RatAB toxin-antitoxin module n=1 Tax=Candidatus Fervidibacter sacchari TaxID=1448929 RepID=A0ABT2EJY5_9BACT|nr:SRPBCC family protein [Candidatus Fervidibacter sacchari]MCS3917994.1 ribosome-associated toxin RatA of RatAB toxin-antitoxin module [Candidatus Fervidibacter sacchari]WKU15810.1 SRPBCC family protein [Candidatus Fervidibacter sacchari]
MAETLTVEQIVRAPLEQVFATARQVERFPDWLDYVTAIRVLERSEDGKVVISEWEASVPMFGLKARWVERDEWDEEKKVCRFALQEGDLDKYEGEWLFEPHPEGTKMRLIVNYEYRVPIGGAIVQQLVRKIVEQMAQKLLEGVAKATEQSMAR